MGGASGAFYKFGGGGFLENNTPVIFLLVLIPEAWCVQFGSKMECAFTDLV